MEHSRKRRWILRLILLGTALLISYPIRWIYFIIKETYGDNVSNLALAGLIAIIMILVMRGVYLGAAIENTVRGQVMALTDPPKPGSTIAPFVLRLFGKAIFQYPSTDFVFEIPDADKECTEPYVLGPKSRRRRKPRSPFPFQKIKKAVLKWEQRDALFMTATLPKFLDQEFGTSPTGTPLMPTSTFYDWRRYILDEMKAGADESSGPIRTKQCDPS